MLSLHTCLVHPTGQLKSWEVSCKLAECGSQQASRECRVFITWPAFECILQPFLGSDRPKIGALQLPSALAQWCYCIITTSSCSCILGGLQWTQVHVHWTTGRQKVVNCSSRDGGCEDDRCLLRNPMGSCSENSQGDWIFCNSSET